MRFLRPLLLLAPVALILMLPACNLAAPAALRRTPSPAPATDPTATPLPAPTPTEVSNKVVLLANESADFPSAAVRSALETLAADSGFELLTLNEAETSDLPAGTRIVITGLDPNALDTYRRQSPDAHFVLIGPYGDNPPDGITMLPMGDVLEQQLAFAAGYTAALLTEDYRAGLLLPSDQPDLSTAYANGIGYYCGLCRPVYPPYVSYPAITILTPGNSDDAAQSLADRSVRTAYLVGSALTADSLGALASRGIQAIGRSRPAAAESGAWLASIRPAPEQALVNLWPQLIAEDPPARVDVPIVVDERDQIAFSSGKLRLVDEMIADLQAGWIDVGVAPPSP